LINKKLTLLCKNIIIINEQHGFRTGRSTITNLSIFKQSILDSFKTGFQTDVIYTDLEKAFDRVNHKLFILKLKAYGFCDPLLSWFKSFLTNRTYNLLNMKTLSLIISMVVPQGDHLSLLLFLLFINDIVYELKHSNFLLLADDLKLFDIIRCQNNIMLLQNDLNSSQKWCDINGMSLNIEKCATISFSLKKEPIIFD